MSKDPEVRLIQYILTRLPTLDAAAQKRVADYVARWVAEQKTEPEESNAERAKAADEREAETVRAVCEWMREAPSSLDYTPVGFLTRLATAIERKDYRK